MSPPPPPTAAGPPSSPPAAGPQLWAVRAAAAIRHRPGLPTRGGCSNCSPACARVLAGFPCPRSARLLPTITSRAHGLILSPTYSIQAGTVPARANTPRRWNASQAVNDEQKHGGAVSSGRARDCFLMPDHRHRDDPLPRVRLCRDRVKLHGVPAGGDQPSVGPVSGEADTLLSDDPPLQILNILRWPEVTHMPDAVNVALPSGDYRSVAAAERRKVSHASTRTVRLGPEGSGYQGSTPRRG